MSRLGPLGERDERLAADVDAEVVFEVGNGGGGELVDRQEAQAGDRADAGADVGARQAADDGTVQRLFPLPQGVLLGRGQGPSGQPDPEATGFAQRDEPDVAVGVGEARREDVLHRRQGLAPGRRGGLDRELVEDPAGDHGRGGPRRRAELEEPGAKAGEGLQPLPGLVIGQGRARGIGLGRDAVPGWSPGPAGRCPERLVQRRLGAALSDGHAAAAGRRGGPARPRRESKSVPDRRADHGTAQNARDPECRPTSLWHGCLLAKPGTVSRLIAPPRAGDLIPDPEVGSGPAARREQGASTPSSRDLSSRPESGKVDPKKKLQFHSEFADAVWPTTSR